jgi:hypothetical protein
MFEFFLVVDHLLGRFVFDLVDPAREVPVSRELITSPPRGEIAVRVCLRPPQPPSRYSSPPRA